MTSVPTNNDKPGRSRDRPGRFYAKFGGTRSGALTGRQRLRRGDLGRRRATRARARLRTFRPTLVRAEARPRAPPTRLARLVGLGLFGPARLALDDAVRQLPHDDLDRAHRVVV